MKRFRILAVLLLALASIVPLTGSVSASEGECPSYPYCASHSDCPDGFCSKRPVKGCGICA